MREVPDSLAIQTACKMCLSYRCDQLHARLKYESRIDPELYASDYGFIELLSYM